MMMEKKQIFYHKNWQSFLHLFICPICGKKLNVTEPYQYICENHHQFDLTAKGYLNMALGKKGGGYSSNLFQARRIIVEAGFFENLYQQIARIIVKHHKEYPIILDAGCGEGSFIRYIDNNLTNIHAAIGIDIEKTAIMKATDFKSPKNLWFVGDLSQIPISENSIDIICNILTPSHYSEFKRILQNDGIVIKVIPGPKYLEEIRNFSGKEQKNNINKTEQTVKRFQTELKMNEKYEFRQSFTLSQTLLQALLDMTPLTNHLYNKNSITLKDIPQITQDWIILVSSCL